MVAAIVGNGRMQRRVEGEGVGGVAREVQQGTVSAVGGLA